MWSYTRMLEGERNSSTCLSIIIPLLLLLQLLVLLSVLAKVNRVQIMRRLRLKSSGMLQCVNKQTVTDMSNGKNAFIFRVGQSNWTSWYNTTFQKTWIFKVWSTCYYISYSIQQSNPLHLNCQTHAHSFLLQLLWRLTRIPQSVFSSSTGNCIS